MAEPWFDAIRWAWLPATLLGVLGGLLGTLVGVLAPQGKARPLVFGLGWLFLGVSLTLLTAGLTALVSGQPYGVWYGLGLAGLLGTVIIAPLFPIAKKRYQEAEQRREFIRETNDPNPGVQHRATKLPRTFDIGDIPITQDGVTIAEDGWRIEVNWPRTVRLFEIADPDAEECRLIYQAQLKCEKLRGKAYLEMWCRFPSHGEFFSKDILHPLRGTSYWASYETPFFLKKGERPDLIKLNLAIKGAGLLSRLFHSVFSSAPESNSAGIVWIKDVSLRIAPL